MSSPLKDKSEDSSKSDFDIEYISSKREDKEQKKSNVNETDESKIEAFDVVATKSPLSKSLEDLYNCPTDVSEESSKQSESQEISDNGSQSDDGRKQGAAAEEYDTSDDTIDVIDLSLKMQKTKRRESENESEPESINEDSARDINISLSIRNESPTKETESFATDDVPITPFEDTRLDQNKRIASTSPSSSEIRDSANSKTPNDEPLSIKLENLETLAVESSTIKSVNPETPDDQFSGIKSHNLDRTDDQSPMNISDNPENLGDETETSKSDSLTTSESERDLDDKKYKPSNSQKRKLSVIYEETEESGKATKRLRQNESDEEA